ncbi:hypothetical protein QJS04_geneDACA022909 [Acorus gramineus]|uniref:Uncharacterized protein n=1 Tax=Acorus gramineus TaxID=55184 RepID=A0AAV9A339_ACOGR|nr:hypothetical protein QJS04_geneDACA022909 [Acorus gramineus]
MHTKAQQRQENENKKELPVPSVPASCNADQDQQNKKHETWEDQEQFPTVWDSRAIANTDVDVFSSQPGDTLVKSFGEPQVATDLLGKPGAHASGVVGFLIFYPCQDLKEPSFVIDLSPPSIEPINGPAPSTEDLKSEVRKKVGNQKAKPLTSSMLKDSSWLVGGDFNEVRYSSEKSGGKPVHSRRLRKFNSCIDDSGLQDLKAFGHTLSWNNRQDKRIMCRLDRFLHLGHHDQALIPYSLNA